MRERSRDTLMTAMATILTVVMISVVFVILFRYSPEAGVLELKDGWTVHVESEKEIDNVDISGISGMLKGGLPKGKKVTISREIPDKVKDYHTPTLWESANYSATEVYLNGKPIAEFAKEDYKAGDFIGEEGHYVDLQGVKPGDMVSLVYQIAEDNVNPNISVPRLGNYMDLQRSFLFHNIYPLFAGIFLCIFGLFFMIVSLILRPLLPEVMGQLASSILSLVFGIYILTSSRVSSLFFYSGHSADVEYVCLFLIVPIMYLVFSQIHKVKHVKAYVVISALSTALVGLFFILHFTNAAHMLKTRPAYLILLTIMTLIILVNDFRDIRERKLSMNNVIQMSGPTLFCLLVLPCTVYTVIMETFLRQAINSFVVLNILTSACMLFTLSRFLIYLLLLSETDQRREEFMALTHKAYHDPLTDAFNNNYYEESIKKLDDGNWEYGILSIRLEGLNGLTYAKGHEESDKWLRSFGSTLILNTPEDGSSFRTGKDTFEMIVRSGERGILEHVTENITRAMRILDYNDTAFPHVVSLGIAYSDEDEGGARDIARLANARRKSSKN